MRLTVNSTVNLALATSTTPRSAIYIQLKAIYHSKVGMQLWRVRAPRVSFSYFIQFKYTQTS